MFFDAKDLTLSVIERLKDEYKNMGSMIHNFDLILEEAFGRLEIAKQTASRKYDANWAWVEESKGTFNDTSTCLYIRQINDLKEKEADVFQNFIDNLSKTMENLVELRKLRKEEMDIYYEHNPDDFEDEEEDNEEE